MLDARGGSDVGASLNLLPADYDSRTRGMDLERVLTKIV